jgi:preprotein translocase SecE subunit
MSLIQSKESLSDVQIAGNARQVPATSTPLPPAKKEKKVKKQGFIGSTFAELKKVQWPSFRYTSSWSVVVVLFTVVLSLLMGTCDKVFQDSIEYIQCRTNTTASICDTQLKNHLLFR